MSESSYNGWPASKDPSSIGVKPFTVAGVSFPGGIKAGDVATVLSYVFNAMHTRVEPIHDGWCWGYNYRANVNNPSTLSCHSSATAGDWNAPDHPNGSRGTFSNAQVAEIEQILDEVDGCVQWGGHYSGTADEMHFEIIVSASVLAKTAARLRSVPPPGGDDDDMPIMLTNPGNRQVALLDGGKMAYISSPDTVANMQAAGIKGPVNINSGDWAKFTSVFDYNEDETPIG